MSSEIKLKTVPLDKTVNIEVSGAFLQRLQTLYLSYANDLGTERIEQPLSFITSNKDISTIEDPQMKLDTINLETLIILLNEIETEFVNANLSEDTTIDSSKFNVD
jgi:hypothetical protein